MCLVAIWLIDRTVNQPDCQENRGSLKHMLDACTRTFVVLFVVMDSLSLAPIFAAFTPKDDATYRK
jgi:hypothetical protein